MTPEMSYKIAVNIPAGFLDALMNEITEAVEPLYPGYDRVFTHWTVTGTWRPLPGSDPYDGEIGKIQVSEEEHIEFAIDGRFLRAAVEAILRIHPYEEPAIDIIPMHGWRSVIPSDGR